jgi:glutathione S-transferase
MMKLFYSPTSPYARKCRAVLREKGLLAQTQEIAVNPWGTEVAELCIHNPLGRVPALVTGGGMDLFDSPVIAEYLDSLTLEPRLIPAEGPARFAVLRAQALADGIVDDAVALVTESRRPADERSNSLPARWRNAIVRSVPAVKTALADLPLSLSLGHVAIAVALAYLDFRQPDIDWREGNADLASWYETYAARPAMLETAPPPGA